MDIWQSGSASDQYLSTGWLGRYLDSNCPACQVPYNGLEVDDTLSLAMKGDLRKGLALKNPEKFHQLTQNRFIAQVSGEKPTGTVSEWTTCTRRWPKPRRRPITSTRPRKSINPASRTPPPNSGAT